MVGPSEVCRQHLCALSVVPRKKLAIEQTARKGRPAPNVPTSQFMVSAHLGSRSSRSNNT